MASLTIQYNYDLGCSCIHSTCMLVVYAKDVDLLPPNTKLTKLAMEEMIKGDYNG